VSSGEINRSRRFRVGIRLPDWATGFGFRLFEGLLDFQRARQAMELHFDQPSGGDLPPAPIDRNWRGDGLLVFRHTRQEADAWRARGIQVVNLSAEIPGAEPDFPRVTVDNRLVGRMAVEHLESLGLRNFAYVHESTRGYSAERLRAFREAVAECGGSFHQIDVPVSSFPVAECPQRIEQAVLGPLAALPLPCGILTKDDIAAVWTLNALRKLGIRCPDEVPLMGITDDIVFCHTTDPPLTSIPYPARKIAFAAADLLHRMMSGERVPPKHRLMIPPLPIAARESTRRVVLADQVVTRAMEIIRQQSAHGTVAVSALARAAGVSRESLRQRFQAALGRSPKQEIERLRCRHVCEVLRWSDLTLDQIAGKCGFTGPDEVCRFVKRHTGKTPGTIRKELA
jgi:LacI family transcriptional regulator